MGGSSSSANQTSTTTITRNQSNSAAFNGDMSGHVITGNEGTTVNLLDGGAVNKALDSMYQNSLEAFSFGKEALAVNEAVSKAAMTSNSGVIDKAFEFAQSASDAALGVAKNLSLDSDAATARDANKNMMYTAVAIAVAGALLAFKK
ncbi:hypothetical protein SD340_001113 [Vibrio fluvialis]|uniref:hypothetical protein n=1 Tax=Vibrio sp. LQ2 TaxID=2883075 RepID=UPI001C9D0B02|nr:hypothetical protein [Vibrio sp. LQ2]ELC0658516.1 hypothetical protein [Vibrio fluvialis]ELL4666675.1 hypothetical protein [Vibrio fluvialis]ELU8399298.1 hypothetical protein [Vibrio fluvialis]MBY7942607.1 hypothetical protein [Vibrio fluvialis]MBY8270212.1 hypothetical protein [Vibrio fluvialis]